MKKSKPSYYTEILDIFKEIKTLYPSYTIGKHISTALDDYGDIWGMSDKEVLFALTKYKAQMEMDVPHVTGEEELNQIMNDAMNLSIKNEEEYEEDY